MTKFNQKTRSAAMAISVVILELETIQYKSIFHFKKNFSQQGDDMSP
jgi:hypothetical protein